jgi:hypothetical protein
MASDNNESGLEIRIHKFPYTLNDLRKLTKRDIDRAIHGAMNSYGSREILQALNPGEYLAILSSALDVKIDADFRKTANETLNRVRTESNDEKKKECMDALFIDVLRHINSVSYNRHGWRAKAGKFPQPYSAKYGMEQKRTALVPAEEKYNFVLNLFNSRLNYIEDFTQKGTAYFDYDLVLDTKEDRSRYLLRMLRDKWDGEDAANMQEYFERKPGNSYAC